MFGHMDLPLISVANMSQTELNRLTDLSKGRKDELFKNIENGDGLYLHDFCRFMYFNNWPRNPSSVKTITTHIKPMTLQEFCDAVPQHLKIRKTVD